MIETGIIIGSGLFLLGLILYIAWDMYTWHKGQKCPNCKQRTFKWKHWYDFNLPHYTGYIWCPKCGSPYRKGFQDRVFG